MSSLDLPNIREPFIDPNTGQISRPWWIWVQQLMTRIGGSNATDLTALTALVTALLATTRAQDNEINGQVPLPTPIDAGINSFDPGWVGAVPLDYAAQAPVQSVFGRIGAVTGQSGDYTVGQVTNAASVLTPLSQFAATTSAQLAGVLSDETGSGSAVFGTTPTLNQPNIVGTTTNNNAAAGSVGEYIPASASTGLTNSTFTNVTSISLTAGDWDVFGGFLLAASGGAVMLNQAVGASSTSATLGANGTYYQFADAAIAANATMGGAMPTQRFSLASTTTIYAVVFAQFASGSVTATAKLDARRFR